MQRIVTILDTALTVNYNDRPITTQKELDTYKFEFDDTWTGYVKTAVFYTDPAMVKHLLIPEDGIVTIPWEILTGKPQVLYIGVFGTKDTKVKPTTFGAVRLRDGSYIDGVAPLPPTPDVYQQIIGAWEGAKADEAERVANENSRRNNFDALVVEYNGLKADLQQQITDGTASVDALQVLESQYAAKALALETTYAPELNGVKSQLAENPSGTLQFIKRLTDGQVTKIKLIGDSITAGVNCAGYSVPVDGRVILTGSRFNDGGTGYAREAQTDWNICPSWANLFRKYIKTEYPSIDFFNAGIGGLSLNEVVTNYLSQIVTASEDIVIIMLGVNDRWIYDIQTYETNMRTLIEYAQARSNLVVLMSPPPTTSEFVNNNPSEGLLESAYYGSRDIDNSNLKLSKEYGIPFISHYLGTSEFIANTNTIFYGNKGVNGDYTHPTTLGYKVMWQTIQRHFKFANDVTEWQGNSLAPVVIIQENERSTPFLPADFPLGTSYTRILNAQALNLGMPISKGGLLLTYKSDVSNSDLYLTQFYITTSYIYYYRDYTGTAWNPWQQLATTANGVFKFNNSAQGLATTDSITTFGEKTVTYSATIDSNADIANYPEGAKGLLTTVRQVAALDLWSYQDYVVYQTARVYRRHWSGSAWTTWKRISGNLSLTTTQRTALSTVGLSKGDNVFDETLNKPVWRNTANNGWVDATGTTV